MEYFDLELDYFNRIGDPRSPTIQSKWFQESFYGI